jgi:hypothetical protein
VVLQTEVPQAAGLFFQQYYRMPKEQAGGLWYNQAETRKTKIIISSFINLDQSEIRRYIVKKLFIASLILMLFCISEITYAVVHTDDFNKATLDKMWTNRDPKKNGKYRFEKGFMVLDLNAGADLYIQGTDGGVMFLMDPPNLTDFSIEALVNVCVNGTQPPACQVGPIFFNESKWAYTLWGPYSSGTDIRLEDCVGGTYRWRAEAQIAVDVNKVAIDQDVYVKITKKGDSLEFFAKGKEDEAWVSGGVDTKLGPNYKPGTYKIGLFAKSWGGSVNSTFQIDYFDIPEIPKAVSSNGKITATWAGIKSN